MSVRLNKLLAQRGLGARRKCDALIESGVVRVNGRVVREPGTRVEPERDRIEVRGRPIPGRPDLRYYALNKPVGVISTLDDPEGRRTVRELLPPGPRVFPVGRLDADTSGLLVLTNDGELAHRLMHPRYGVDKHYRVRVSPPPSPAQIERLRRGVAFEPGIVSAPARATALAVEGESAVLAISIHEGRYRQVRRMCEAVGLRVLSLHRAGYGPLRLGPIARGLWRELSDDEVRRLRAASARPHSSGRPRLSRFDRLQRRAAGIEQRSRGRDTVRREAESRPRDVAREPGGREQRERETRPGDRARGTGGRERGERGRMPRDRARGTGGRERRDRETMPGDRARGTGGRERGERPAPKGAPRRFGPRPSREGGRPAPRRRAESAPSPRFSGRGERRPPRGEGPERRFTDRTRSTRRPGDRRPDEAQSFPRRSRSARPSLRRPDAWRPPARSDRRPRGATERRSGSGGKPPRGDRRRGGLTRRGPRPGR